MDIEDTTTNYQRFYDAIDSMEKQLSSLYEEKLQHSSLQDKAKELEDLLEKIKEEKKGIADTQLRDTGDISVSDIEPLKDYLININSKLDELCNDSNRQIDSEFMDQCSQLTQQLSIINEKIVEVSSGSQQQESEIHKSVISDSGNPALEKKAIAIIKENTELANENLKLQKALDEAKLSLESTQGTNDKQLLNLKEELSQELRRYKQELSEAKNELAQTKLRYKEIGSMFIEKFFGD